MSLFGKLFGKEQPQQSPQPQQPPQPSSESDEAALEKAMRTLDQTLVVEPFGKINYWDLPDGGKRVRAYFLMERPIEGAQTGVAIDGSGSMKSSFQGKNIVEEQARKLTAYLSKFDADGGTTVIYWAAGNGREIEVIGDLTGEQCLTTQFNGPKNFGRGTHLLPAIEYFVDRFADARWGMYVFITDGALSDLYDVKKYCIQLARDIANNKRNDLKFVLIGVGDNINEEQMEELDDLETGTDLDLWDHKIAKEMKQLAEIFAEVVSETVIVVPGDGIIKDANGNVVKDYRDSGLPALMLFDLPPESQWFTLQIGGREVSQPLEPGVQPPSA